MKQMAGELKMYHSQVKDLRDEIDRYKKDFGNVKQAYFNNLRQRTSMEQYGGLEGQ